MSWQEMIAWSNVLLTAGLLLGIVYGLNNISKP